jgi:hypothetical protein
VKPFGYPRAGQEGVPGLASEVEALLVDAASQGIPLWRLGPSLVLGFFRFFRRLPKHAQGIDKNQVPGLYTLLGSGTQPLKMSRSDSAYQARPVGSQRCSNCSSFYTQGVTGDSICSQVEGKVQASHWCRLWNTDRD